MTELIQRYFQIGLVSAMAYAPALKETPWPEVIRSIAADPYFDAVEVNPLPDQETRQQVRALADQGHISLYYNAHGRLMAAGANPNDLDEEGRKVAEEILLAGVDEAVELGSPTMGMLAGRWTKETRQQCFEQLRKTVTNVCRYAKEKGILVELEIFDHDIAKCALLGPAPLSGAFAAEIRSQCPNFGLMVDLSHIPMTRETSAQVLDTLRPYITHFHMGNTVCDDPEKSAYGDEHPRFGFPGSSNDMSQVLEYLRMLRKNGFFCAEHPYPLTFEVKPWHGEDVETVLANAKRVLRRAWALLEE